MNLCPTIMVSIENVGPGNRDMLVDVRDGDLVRVALAGCHGVCLRDCPRAYDLDNQSAVLVLIVGAVSEIRVL